MFEQFGQFASLLKNLPKIQQELESFKERLAQLQAEGDAGAGMVKVRVNGHFEMTACHFTPEALQDRELLEDLVRSAVNQAVAKMRQQAAEEAAKMGSGFGLPPGMSLPF